MDMRIERFRFGTIVVDGTTYHRDIVIRADGTVKERKGGIWRFGPHRVKKQDIRELRDAKVAVVGLGTRSRVRLTDDATAYARQVGMDLLLLPSREAVDTFNRLLEEGKAAAALLHITC